MKQPRIVAWTEENFKLGDRRRSRALGEMAWGLIKGGVAGMTAIGRCMVGPATEASKTARVWNFCHNKLFDPKLFQEALFRLLVFLPGAGKVVGAVKLVLLSIDWHHFNNGEQSSLRVSLMVGSRAIPLLWRDVKTSELKGRQRAIEDEVIDALIRLQPFGFVWVLLLDAGFRCSKRIRRMKDSFYYIQRTNCRDLVHSEVFCWTEPRNLGVQSGQVVDFGWVEWCRSDPVRVRLVATYVKVPEAAKRKRRRIRRKASKRRDEGWYLLTNLQAELFDALQVVIYYSRRFECEHNFRDIKNATYGMDMEHVHLKAAETYERLMCIVALASTFLWLFGSEAEMQGWAAQLSPSRPKNLRRVLSLVNVGKLRASWVRRSIPSLIRRHLVPATEKVHSHTGPTWIHPTQPNLRLQGATWDETDVRDAPQVCKRSRRQDCRSPNIQFTECREPRQDVYQLVA